MSTKAGEVHSFDIAKLSSDKLVTYKMEVFQVEENGKVNRILGFYDDICFDPDYNEYQMPDYGYSLVRPIPENNKVVVTTNSSLPYENQHRIFEYDPDENRWKLPPLKLEKRYELPYTHEILAINKNLIVSGHHDGQINIWKCMKTKLSPTDWISQDRIKTSSYVRPYWPLLDEHGTRNAMNALAIVSMKSLPNQILITANRGGAIHFWDIDNKECPLLCSIATYTDEIGDYFYINHLDITPEGQLLASYAGHGNIVIRAFDYTDKPHRGSRITYKGSGIADGTAYDDSVPYRTKYFDITTPAPERYAPLHIEANEYSIKYPIRYIDPETYTTVYWMTRTTHAINLVQEEIISTTIPDKEELDL